MTYKRREWLRELRDHANLTQEQVAEELKIHRSTYAKAEIGAPITVQNAKKIGKFFNCDWTLFFENVKG